MGDLSDNGRWRQSRRAGQGATALPRHAARYRRQVVVLVSAFTLVAAACASAGPTANVDYGRLPISSALVEASSLIDAVSQATQPEIQRCMEDQGFEYFPTLQEESSLDLPEAPPLSLARAREFGYRVPELEHSQAVKDRSRQQDEYLERLGTQADAWWAAFSGPESARISIETLTGRTGTSGEGCLADGRASVAGSPEDELRWGAGLNDLLALRSEAIDMARTDSLVRDAVSVWSACMADSGFTFSGLDDPTLLPDEIPVGETVQVSYGSITLEISKAEIEQAIVDATCRANASYYEIYNDRLSIYENQVLNDEEGILLAWSEIAAEIRTAIPGLSN